MRPRSRAAGRALAGILVVALATQAAGAPEAAATVTVERGESGLNVVAQGAPLEDVLQELADREGFELRMELGVERRPVDLALSDASLDTVLRRVLRRRNYAIAYEATEDGLAVSEVTVLLPQDVPVEQDVRQVRQVRRPSATTAQQRAAAAAQRAAEAQRLREAAVRKYRQDQARRLAARREAIRREAARQVAAEQAPLRRLLWSRGR